MFNNLFRRKNEKSLKPGHKMEVIIKHPGLINEEKPKPGDVSFPGHLLPETLKNFKRIYDALPTYWGTAYFHDYMKKLLLNDGKDGRTHRNGFPFDVMQELHRLAVWHDVAFPKLRGKMDPWDIAYLE